MQHHVERDDARKPLFRRRAARSRRAGLALAVADVGWFNTENLFREIDRESVSVLLLKCQDYVNGWRRGALSLVELVPSAAKRPRLVGAAARAAQRLDEALSSARHAASGRARFGTGGTRSPRLGGAGW